MYLDYFIRSRLEYFVINYSLFHSNINLNSVKKNQVNTIHKSLNTQSTQVLVMPKEKKEVTASAPKEKKAANKRETKAAEKEKKKAATKQVKEAAATDTKARSKCKYNKHSASKFVIGLLATP